MSGSPYPPVAELIPHAGPMILVDAILEHTRHRTRCRVVVGADSPLHDEGAVPAWIGLEYLAQAIAAHGGLHARTAGDPVRPGLLVGCRNLTVSTSGFVAGQVLEAAVAHVWGERDLFAFEGWLSDARDGAVLLHGTLVVARVDDARLTGGRRPHA